MMKNPFKDAPKDLTPEPAVTEQPEERRAETVTVESLSARLDALVTKNCLMEG